MKKIALILLICSYSLATMGFSLKEFYCCGKLKSITVLLVPDAKQKCSKGTGSGCCDNKYQFFKVKDKHISAAEVSSPVNYFTDLNLFIPSFQQISFPPPNIIIADRSHAPPLHSGVSAYIYNCVFRI